MSQAEPLGAVPSFRHPLGLPAGSVRATLAVMIVGYFWLFLLLPAEKSVTIPLYLYFLVGMVLIFFASHGRSIASEGQASPWGLPRGTFRFLIILGTLGVVGWQYYNDPGLLRERLTPHSDQLPQWPTLLLALLAGFLIGWLARHGPWRKTAWFLDIQAWVSLLAMVLLGVEIIIQLFINPGLAQSLSFSTWESILLGIVSFYFGVRS